MVNSFTELSLDVQLLIIEQWMRDSLPRVTRVVHTVNGLVVKSRHPFAHNEWRLTNKAVSEIFEAEIYKHTRYEFFVDGFNLERAFTNWPAHLPAGHVRHLRLSVNVTKEPKDHPEDEPLLGLIKTQLIKLSELLTSTFIDLRDLEIMLVPHEGDFPMASVRSRELQSFLLHKFANSLYDLRMLNTVRAKFAVVSWGWDVKSFAASTKRKTSKGWRQDMALLNVGQSFDKAREGARSAGIDMETLEISREAAGEVRKFPWWR